MSDNEQKKEKQRIMVITPVETECAFEDIFYALAATGRNKYISFLDSSLTPNKFSNFSYLAWEPEFVIKSSGIKNEIMDLRTHTKKEVGGHPLKFLEQMLNNNISSKAGNIYLDYSSIDPKSGMRQQPGFRYGAPIGQKIEIHNEQGICQKDGADCSEVNLPDFKGGFIGFFSYDLKNYIENLPAKAKKDVKVPVFYFCYYLKFLAFNHNNGKCYFVKNYEISDSMAGGYPRELALSESSCFGACSSSKREETGKDLKSNFDGSCCSSKSDAASIETDNYFSGTGYRSKKSFSDYVRKDMSKEKQNIFLLSERCKTGYGHKINDFITKKYQARQAGNLELISNFSKPDYVKAILKTKEHIHNGDIYQANISQRFSCDLDVDPVDLYYILRQKNSAPFCAFLSFSGLKIGCSSPERFMFLKEGKVETRPIKGTRPRGRTPKEDESYIKELQGSLKDHAELNMIVDLERNDLGRFCKYGSVKVKEHAVVEKYARVFHLVSTVTGQMQEGYSHTDIIKAAFPGGSITGAPKIRAMEIIDSLEPSARNIYTGSIGYISLEGTMDLNIAIRTFVIKNKKFYYNVGGGIVEDSTPESEYMETLDKGLALKETLEFFSKENLEVK